LASRPQRQYSRELARIQARGSLLAAQEAAKVDAIAEVTEAALVATANVSAIESLLTVRVPYAEQRLRHIADAGCAAMGNVVLGLGRRV
jgi:hypothetical protein